MMWFFDQQTIYKKIKKIFKKSARQFYDNKYNYFVKYPLYLYVVLCGINILILISIKILIFCMEAKLLNTKLKTKAQKISLSQLVKAIENINVEDIPLNEKNHTLIGKVFNKFNSLKKSHFKNAENKGIVEKVGTNEFRKVSYEYEITKTVWSK